MNRPVAARAIEAPTHGWETSERTNVERTVRRAGRHSRMVRVLRIGLPALVVLGLGAYVVVAYYDPLAALNTLPTVSGKLAVQGSKITMEAPRIAGVGRNQRSYQITAESAVQDIAKPDQIELLNLRAELEMAESDMMVVTAKTGTYNTKGDNVVLREHVVFTTTQGYNAKMREAVIEMKKGTLRSDKPVDVKMPAGRVVSNAAEIEESGEVIRFTKGVVFDVNAEEPGAKK